jgi:hypothetical protein
MTTHKWHPCIRPQDVRVGKYFVLSDFLYSRTAIVEGIPNVPLGFDGPEVAGIRGLCAHILDPVVEQFGPVSITFGYCSAALWRRMYGANANLSDLHTFKPKQGGIGGAVDIVIHHHEDARPVMRWIKENCIYDRLIAYPGSRILCVAWCETKPRRHCKEWVIPEGGGRRQYVNFDQPPKPQAPPPPKTPLFTQGLLFE